MSKVLTLILGYLGYEIRRKSTLNRHGVEDALESPGLEKYFYKTEGMISLEEATLLYHLARNVANGCILEIGSYRGRSTVALGRGSLDGHGVPIYAFEPHEEFKGVLGGDFGPADRGAFYRAMLDTSCYLVVRLVNLSSEYVAPNWDKKVGLLWIDGNHTYKAVKRDFECWLPHLAPDALVAFDDSTNPELGPRHLIGKITASKEFEEIQRVGKVSVLKRRKFQASA